MQEDFDVSAAPLGRRRERAILDDLIDGVRDGHSAAFVMYGEDGIGKTTLLGYGRERAAGCRIVSLDGAPAETRLDFGGLHRLCAPFLAHADRLPQAQRRALETAFGLRPGSAPGRFLMGLATLNLLGEGARRQPLVCLIDDAHWLDETTLRTLAFVARRLSDEQVLLLLAARSQRRDILEDLPHHELTGLSRRDSGTLLAATHPRPIDDPLRDRILDEAHGNPRALIEETFTGEGPGQGVAVAPEHPIPRQVEDLVACCRSLTPSAQRLLLLAAAEPVGDLALLRRAAEEEHIDVERAISEIEAADIVTVRSMLRFRHPFLRSAIYRTATQADRHRVHRSLAAASASHSDLGRRLWHLAQGITAPDELVAAGLERDAGQALTRHDAGSQAALLSRAAQLTPDPQERGRRTLAAAAAMTRTARFHDAAELLDAAELHHLDARALGGADLVRGRLLLAARSPGASLPILLNAAQRLERADPALATEAYRDALYAALTAGQLTAGPGLKDVAVKVLSSPAGQQGSPAELLLRGLARMATVGYADGAPTVQASLLDIRDGGVGPDERLDWLPVACRLAHDTWEFGLWSVFSAELIEGVRHPSASHLLPQALLLRQWNRLLAGDSGTAAALQTEAEASTREAGGWTRPYGLLMLAACRGSESDTRRAIEVISRETFLKEEGSASTATAWARAVLYNGLGHHALAVAPGLEGSAYPDAWGLATWCMVELVEAATGANRPTPAAAAVQHITTMAAVTGTDWALGTAAYVRAQVTETRQAEALYREAGDRFERAGVRFFAARAQLLLGELLEREGRTGEARQRLEKAPDRLRGMGMAAFAERARIALEATGARGIRQAQVLSTRLSAQEAKIARLAAEGFTNPEIGARLFISPHTAEWHMRKVLRKLGIRSRDEIAAALPADEAGE